jgi:excisionase family DNA binding protein
VEADPVSPRYLTPKELSEWLKIPEGTLANMRAQPGQDPLPFVKIGRLVRYREDQVRKWLERNTFHDTLEAKEHAS